MRSWQSATQKRVLSRTPPCCTLIFSKISVVYGINVMVICYNSLSWLRWSSAKSTGFLLKSHQSFLFYIHKYLVPWKELDYTGLETETHLTTEWTPTIFSLVFSALQNNFPTRLAKMAAWGNSLSSPWRPCSKWTRVQFLRYAAINDPISPLYTHVHTDREREWEHRGYGASFTTSQMPKWNCSPSEIHSPSEIALKKSFCPTYFMLMLGPWKPRQAGQVGKTQSK